jgi:hypothetical protein
VECGVVILFSIFATSGKKMFSTALIPIRATRKKSSGYLIFARDDI